jgi:hypothetical protein
VKCGMERVYRCGFIVTLQELRQQSKAPLRATA